MSGVAVADQQKTNTPSPLKHTPWKFSEWCVSVWLGCWVGRLGLGFVGGFPPWHLQWQPRPDLTTRLDETIVCRFGPRFEASVCCGSRGCGSGFKWEFPRPPKEDSTGMQGPSPQQTHSGGGWTAQQVHACDKRTRFGVFASVIEFACWHKKELEPQLAVHGRAGAIHRAQVAPFVINSHDEALFASVIGHTLKGNCISDSSSSAPTTTTLVQCVLWM